MKRGRHLTCREPGSAQWKAWKESRLQSELKLEFKTMAPFSLLLLNTAGCLHGAGTASTLPASPHFPRSPLPAGRSLPCDLLPRWPPNLGAAHQTISGTSESERQPEKGTDENPDLHPVASRGRSHLPVCTWPRLQLASEWGSWRWDGGPSPPADPWDVSCRDHIEETCEPAVWWCQWGDSRPGPWGTPKED